MSIRISLNIKDKGVQEALGTLGKKAEDLRRPMREAGMFMERELKLGFAKESDPDGAPWAPLKPSTLRQKRSGAILRETSALAGSIALQSVSSSNVRVGSSGVAYGIYHQTGTSKMVARKFIGIGDRHIPKIRKIFERHFGA